MPEAKYKIELFSGGEIIRHWYSDIVNTMPEGDFYFSESKTGKRIMIKGTIIVTEL